MKQSRASFGKRPARAFDRRERNAALAVRGSIVTRVVFGGFRVYIGGLVIGIALLFMLRWIFCAEHIDPVTSRDWGFAALATAVGVLVTAWGITAGRKRLLLVRSGARTLVHVGHVRKTEDTHNGRIICELTLCFTSVDGKRVRGRLFADPDSAESIAEAFPAEVAYDIEDPARAVLPYDIPGDATLLRSTRIREIVYTILSLFTPATLLAGGACAVALAAGNIETCRFVIALLPLWAILGLFPLGLLRLSVAVYGVPVEWEIIGREVEKMEHLEVNGGKEEKLGKLFVCSAIPPPPRRLCTTGTIQVLTTRLLLVIVAVTLVVRMVLHASAAGLLVLAFALAFTGVVWLRTMLFFRLMKYGIVGIAELKRQDTWDGEWPTRYFAFTAADGKEYEVAVDGTDTMPVSSQKRNSHIVLYDPDAPRRAACLESLPWKARFHPDGLVQFGTLIGAGVGVLLVAGVAGCLVYMLLK